MAAELKKNLEAAGAVQRTGMLLERAFDRALQKRLGFGFSQFQVMQVLASHPRVPQKFVATALEQTQAAVSRQLEILSRQKLVQRAANAENRREYVLALTKAGARKYRQAVMILAAKTDRCLQPLTIKERMLLVETLDKIMYRLRAYRY
jgi:DNA-binding MarR family transcriptional regulator